MHHRRAAQEGEAGVERRVQAAGLRPKEEAALGAGVPAAQPQGQRIKRLGRALQPENAIPGIHVAGSSEQ